MQVMKRLVFMGLGLALTGYLSGAPVFAADKPIEDGSKIVITSSKTGDKETICRGAGRTPEVDWERLVADLAAFGERQRSRIADASLVLQREMARGFSVLFEGAQATLLDLDHGTYPYVTSSSTCAGGVYTGTGVAPRSLDAIIGISKAYCTGVGEGPFPSELLDAVGDTLRKAGNEFGSTTGRPRRCGWFDAVALREAGRLNGLAGLAITKLDVLNDFDAIKVCTGYSYQGQLLENFPRDPDVLA